MKFNPKEPGLYSQLNSQGVIEIGVLGGCQSDQGSGKKNTYLYLNHHGEINLLFVNCNA